MPQTPIFLRLSEQARAHHAVPSGTATLLAQLDAVGIPREYWDHIARVFAEFERYGDAKFSDDVLVRHEQRLDTIIKFPWARRARPLPTLASVAARLHTSHYGLEDVKEELLRLCALNLRAARARPGHASPFPPLLLVGEPGVGKTSLAQALAGALGRRLVVVSLAGGVDSEHLLGFPLPYRGSRHGALTEALIRAGERDPLLVLDEVDKATDAGRSAGRPTDALLPLLDPTLNGRIVDRFLDVPLDFSGVTFVMTANYLERIEPALVDRARVITIRGYSSSEKLAIARDYLLPPLLDEFNLGSAVTVEAGALDLLTGAYSPEAGVRLLRQRLEGLLGSAALALELGQAKHVRLDAAAVRAALGHPEREHSVMGFRATLSTASGSRPAER
jgi:ATP-dependent Lon protease